MIILAVIYLTVRTMALDDGVLDDLKITIRAMPLVPAHKTATITLLGRRQVKHGVEFLV